MLKFQRTSGGSYLAELSCDERTIILARIIRTDYVEVRAMRHCWRVEWLIASQGTSFDTENFERDTLTEAKTELQAILFVALIGSRSDR